MTLTRTALVALLATAVAPVATARAGETTILPGYWESTDRLEVLLTSTKVVHKCLTADQVNQWLTAPATGHYTCTYDQRQVGGGHASFHGKCVDKRGRSLTVAITGVYTPEQFHLTAHFRYMLSAGIAIPGDATTDAHRISAQCPETADAGK